MVWMQGYIYFLMNLVALQVLEKCREQRRGDV